ALLGLAIGVALAFLLPSTYMATAVILPPQQQSSTASALMGAIGSLAGLSSKSDLPIKNPSDMYVGLLQSRTIADGLIDKFHLQQVYRTKTLMKTRKVLKKHSTIVNGKDSLISVTVKEHDPNLASNLANGYIRALYSMNSNLALTDAAQRREFFEQQLDQEKNALANAEKAFKDTEVKTGVIQLSGQAESVISRMAALSAQIASQEVQLRAMKTFATDENPDLIRSQQSIAELRKQLTQLQSVQSKEAPGGFSLSAGKVPEASLAYMRKYRDLQFHETLYQLLATQYETARIDEAKSAPLIQVVDKAVPPEKRSGPPRVLIILGCIFVGFLLGVLWSLAVRSWKNMRDTPEKMLKMDHIRRALRK
ncbi:MAG TPA: GNVR domain-containing protein, partial [Acidobacteriaceae bacterium]|nr:GNVR domain-containing protein [Acidobacteriaceae bacterium]